MAKAPDSPAIILARLLRDAHVEAWLDLEPATERLPWEELNPSGRAVHLAVARHLLAAGIRFPAGARVPCRKPPEPPKEQT